MLESRWQGRAIEKRGHLERTWHSLTPTKSNTALWTVNSKAKTLIEAVMLEQFEGWEEDKRTGVPRISNVNVQASRKFVIACHR